MTGDADVTARKSQSGGYTRRGVLGASAALGVAAIGVAPVAAVAAEQHDGGGQPNVPAAAHDGTGTPGPKSADSAIAVWGASPSGLGTGVRGSGHVGVLGEGSDTGVAGDGHIGVRGTTSIAHDGQEGIGVWAQAETPGGIALRADGPSVFNGGVDFAGITTFSRSGVVTVPRGHSSVTTAGVTLTASTVILATPQNRVPEVHVQAVETDPSAGSFTCYLTARSPTDVRIGWIAIG